MSAAPVDAVLQTAVREIEAHAAEGGWDQPARLYALVPTSDLLAREPALAAAMGIDAAAAAGSLTPVEQEAVPADTPLETVLERIVWPGEVAGCAAVVERLVLPPSVDDQLPADPEAAERFAAEHPDREEVRIVAGATRAGSTYCALRLRAHDDALSVVEAPDLVPGLLELVRSTLET
ncbi:MAG TPA: PPA1309 family protein [Nocardioidaceae bacterium]|nr:PPA1309 family protein [Nocardioidaceae bacterium]